MILKIRCLHYPSFYPGMFIVASINMKTTHLNLKNSTQKNIYVTIQGAI